MGTGFLYNISRGSRATFLHNAAHLAQFPLAESYLLVEALGDVVRHIMEVITETRALGGFHSHQGSLCG